MAALPDAAKRAVFKKWPCPSKSCPGAGAVQDRPGGLFPGVGDGDGGTAVQRYSYGRT